jgi:hypothetical protein
MISWCAGCGRGCWVISSEHPSRDSIRSTEQDLWPYSPDDNAHLAWSWNPSNTSGDREDEETARRGQSRAEAVGRTHLAVKHRFHLCSNGHLVAVKRE